MCLPESPPDSSSDGCLTSPQWESSPNIIIVLHDQEFIIIFIFTISRYDPGHFDNGTYPGSMITGYQDPPLYSHTQFPLRHPRSCYLWSINNNLHLTFISWMKPWQKHKFIQFEITASTTEVQRSASVHQGRSERRSTSPTKIFQRWAAPPLLFFQLWISWTYQELPWKLSWNWHFQGGLLTTPSARGWGTTIPSKGPDRCSLPTKHQKNLNLTLDSYFDDHHN